VRAATNAQPLRATRTSVPNLNSKNVVSVSSPTAGEFCVTLASSIDFTTTGVVAIPVSSADDTSYGLRRG